MMLPGDEAFLASVKSARISSFHNSPVCSLDEIDLCAVNIYTVSTQDLSCLGVYDGGHFSPKSVEFLTAEVNFLPLQLALIFLGYAIVSENCSLDVTFIL